MGIPVDKMADAIKKELGEYSDKVAEGTKKVVDRVAKEAADDLRQTGPVRTGKYRKGWTTSESFENVRTKRDTVHNRSRYQLTHLLENGHAKRGGGRVAARVHISPVEAKIEKKLEDGIKEVAQG